MRTKLLLIHLTRTIKWLSNYHQNAPQFISIKSHSWRFPHPRLLVTIHLFPLFPTTYIPLPTITCQPKPTTISWPTDRLQWRARVPARETPPTTPSSWKNLKLSANLFTNPTLLQPPPLAEPPPSLSLATPSLPSSPMTPSPMPAPAAGLAAACRCLRGGLGLSLTSTKRRRRRNGESRRRSLRRKS